MTAQPAARYALARTVDLDFEEADQRIRDTLQDEGFGILSEIDVRAKLREKLGHELPHGYLILGACAPPLAKQAIEAEPDVGLLLPCNVVVRGSDAGTVVEIMDPELMLEIARNPKLEPLAREARQRLERALAAVED